MKSMHIGWFLNFSILSSFEYISFFIVMFHNIKTRFVKVNVTKSIDIISLPFLRIHYFSLYITYNNYEIQ